MWLFHTLIGMVPFLRYSSYACPKKSLTAIIFRSQVFGRTVCWSRIATTEIE